MLVDVFTDRPLTGNQLAVFPDGDAVPADRYQDLAREVGFSETVFVLPPSSPVAADVRVRIFTPRTELAFAGHPVLGTALVMAAERDLGPVVTVETGAGPVPLELANDGRSAWMTQPLPTVAPWPDADAVLDAVGVASEVVVAPVEVYDNGVRHLMVAVDGLATVEGAAPDLGRLGRAVPTAGVSVFTVTGPGSVTTRMFGAGLGVGEDAATGSAAGPLGVHALRHGLVEVGAELVVHQGASIDRPSELWVRVEGTPEAVAAVGVGGAAVIVGEGRFRF